MSTAAVFPSARLRRMLATCVFCVSALGAIVEAQEPGGRILGRVQDLTGMPASGASVTVHVPAERAVRADEDGRFVIESLPDGKYTITATLQGFAPSSRTIEIVNGATAAVALTLVPEILEQVTVTADRTGERELQKTPMAISVLSEAQLTQREVHTVADLAGLTPGFTVSQNTGFSQLTIRGIGSTAAFAGSDPSSAVYMDGVYIARPAAVLTQFLDLDRVEVLRGPQGTLYGHNAVGGALNLTTKVPTDDVAFSTRLVVGNFQTSRAEVSASGPLLRGRIMAGGSAVREVSDGSVQDLTPPIARWAQLTSRRPERRCACCSATAASCSSGATTRMGIQRLCTMRKCSLRSPGSRLTIPPTLTRYAHPRPHEAARSITARRPSSSGGRRRQRS